MNTKRTVSDITFPHFRKVAFSPVPTLDHFSWNEHLWFNLLFHFLLSMNRSLYLHIGMSCIYQKKWFDWWDFVWYLWDWKDYYSNISSKNLLVWSYKWDYHGATQWHVATIVERYSIYVFILQKFWEMILGSPEINTICKEPSTK